VITESQHPHCLADHIGVAFLIVMPSFVFSVHAAVTFNHQLRLATIEVGHVIAKLVLAPEFESEKLAISEKLPNQGFGRCLFVP
jgi:hypothetical protein